MRKFKVTIRHDLSGMWVARCPVLECGSMAESREEVLELLKSCMRTNFSAYAKILKEEGGLELIADIEQEEQR